RQVVLEADLVDLDDVGVVQASDGSGLADEPAEPLQSAVGTDADGLQGDQPVEALLARLVDDTHAALAQLIQDLVAGHRPRAARPLAVRPIAVRGGPRRGAGRQLRLGWRLGTLRRSANDRVGWASLALGARRRSLHPVTPG